MAPSLKFSLAACMLFLASGMLSSALHNKHHHARYINQRQGLVTGNRNQKDIILMRTGC